MGTSQMSKLAETPIFVGMPPRYENDTMQSKSLP